MKTTLSIMALWFSVALSHSAPPEPVYPSTELAFEKLSFRRVAQNDLPTRVHFWTSQGAESNEDPEYSGKVCYLDLNNDGTKEIIVESPSNRTNQYEFWQKRNRRWISLLTVWGALDFLSRRNGYYQITVWNEDRQGEGKRELYAFEGKRYHLMRLDRYRGDTFVGVGDVREREQVLESNFKEQFRE